MNNLDKKIEFIDSLWKDAQKMTRANSYVSNSGETIYDFQNGTDTRNFALDRDDYTCFCCDYRPNNVDKLLRTYDIEKGRDLGAHRIVPKKFGGEYVLSNVVILCEECHLKKLRGYFNHKRLYDELEKITEWNTLIDKSFEFFRMFIKEFGNISIKEKKNIMPVFAWLIEEYGKENVCKKVDDAVDAATEVPTGKFYRFEQNEHILIKQHPVAIYSPSRFKYSNDGWGYIGSLQRYEEIATSKDIGNAALIYPFGLSENQLWELIGQVKSVFPWWSSEIDEKFEIVEGLLIDVRVSSFLFEKLDGTTESRKKIRFSIVKDGNGKEGYRNSLEWLNNRIIENKK